MQFKIIGVQGVYTIEYLQSKHRRRKIKQCHQDHLDIRLMLYTFQKIKENIAGIKIKSPTITTLQMSIINKATQKKMCTNSSQTFAQPDFANFIKKGTSCVSPGPKTLLGRSAHVKRPSILLANRISASA